jgi:hypothetical protein
MKNYDLIEPIELIEIDSIVQQRANQNRLVKNRVISFTMLASKEIIIDGYGRCKSCDCRGYISKHNGTHECKNCNHHFDRHWD